MSIYYSKLRQRMSSCLCGTNPVSLVLHVTLLIVILVLALVGQILAADVPKKVTVWGLLSDVDPVRAAAQQKVIDSFNALYKGKIVAEGVFFDGRVEEKLLAAVAGGAAPSVALISRVTMGAYAAQGIVQPLQKYVDRDRIDFRTYFPGPWQETIFNGKSYGLPAHTDVRAVSYNRRLFSESGLPDFVPATWQTMQAASRKLLRGEPGRWTQIGFVPQWGNWYFPAWVWAAGGEILDSTNRKVTWQGAEGLAALNWIVNFNNEQYGGIPAIEAWKKGNSKPLDNEREAMEIQASDSPAKTRANNPNIDLGVGYVPRPTGLENTPISWSGGFGWVIPAGASNPDEAWEFIKYASSENVQKQLAIDLDRLPTNIRAARSPEFNAKDKFWPFLTNLLNYSRFRPVCPGTREVWDIADKRTTALLQKGVSPEEILETTAKEGQIALTESWVKVGM